MSKRIPNGTEIKDTYQAWAVEFVGENGKAYVIECEDTNAATAEENAYITQKMFGGHVVYADVYYTDWQYAVGPPPETVDTLMADAGDFSIDMGDDPR